MPKVLMLLIENRVVGPHLQLLRQICEPRSRSTPHVTIRYFDRLRVPQKYLDTQAPYIDLIAPGMFKPSMNDLSPTKRQSRTGAVFIRCKSDHLAMLEHKPHFPHSDFHITVYN